MAGRGANADADWRRAFGQYSADRPAAHRHQSAADLSALREPVRDSISAKRDGAVSGKTLLVAAVMIACKRIPDAVQRLALHC
jgi:hypothetical protein